MSPDPVTFRVETPSFSGTLGELAHALRGGRLSPAETDVSALVQRYLDFYRRVSAYDFEGATETLPGLARIIELKLRLLLPQPPKTSEEVEEEVLETVLALEAFEEVIHFLRERREVRRYLLPAQAPRPTYPRRARPLTHELGRLTQLASRHRAAHYFELAVERLTLTAAMTILRAGLRRFGRGSLQALMEARDWPTVTVAFGAMLEMVKEGEVRAVQAAIYDAIELEGRA